MNTDLVYLLRKTSLTLEAIGKLSPAQFHETLKELYFQEASEEYRRQHGLAALLAAIYNTIPRKRGSKTLKVEDFLPGGPPQREAKPPDTLDVLAEARGVKLPTKELKERT